MTTPPTNPSNADGLNGQTVVVIGGSAGIGLETARLARANGAAVILTARNEARLEAAGRDVGASRTAAFDATDSTQMAAFLADLPPVDHILITAGSPYYAPLGEMDFAMARRHVADDLVIPLEIARGSVGKVRDGGSLVLMSGTGARTPGVGLTIPAAMTAAIPALAASLAVELAPIRVNVIAAGFVDTALSASILGDQLDARRAQLAATLPIRRVIGPDDVAALAVQLMVNTALTGATYDIDGGQQLISRG
ncbi:MAG TPA: SDR family oxidoreductase [Nocardioidaceae bacterium]|nr:SDR family oxidoreductase [Nocardioidaceae bacterium]